MEQFELAHVANRRLASWRIENQMTEFCLSLSLIGRCKFLSSRKRGRNLAIAIAASQAGSKVDGMETNVWNGMEMRQRRDEQ